LKNEKFLLWFNLNGEFYLIKQLLERLGINFLVIRGGEKSIGKKVKEFNENPSIQVLLCQAKSVNYGITVLGSKPEELEKRHLEMLPEINTRVHIEVFFSINFSLEVYLQQQDRIHRLGQELECLYYRLFTNSSIEIKIRHSIDNKLEIKTELLKDIKDITSTN
jgi:SNF2 family DNA or RNA helicase